MRVITVNGSPFERGVTHGTAFRDDIRAYADDRVGLVCAGQWSHHPLDRATVLDLAEACLEPHRAYAPDLVDEMAGLAQATGTSLAEMLIVSGFTDFVDTVYATYAHEGHAEDDCTAVIVPDHRTDGGGFLAQTWDMHDTATDHVILLDVRSDDAPRSLLLTTTGCVGQIGMNDAGLAIGINNLPGGDGQIGVTWPFVVRKALQQTTIEAALECITGAPLAGAHNYLLFDRLGNGYNVEGFSTVTHVTPLGADVIGHTNHCLAPSTLAVSQTKPTQLQESSELRLATAIDALTDGPITYERIEALTQHPAVSYRGGAPYHVETCGAAIMRPATLDFWACWGLPSENSYEHFSLAPVGA